MTTSVTTVTTVTLDEECRQSYTTTYTERAMNWHERFRELLANAPAIAVCILITATPLVMAFYVAQGGHW